MLVFFIEDKVFCFWGEYRDYLVCRIDDEVKGKGL